jgi:thiol:disulfide interchange protein DsbD
MKALRASPHNAIDEDPMKKKIRWTRHLARQALALLGMTTLSLAAWSAGATDFLDVDRAFVMSPRVHDGQLELAFDVQPGYYLYRERIDVEDADSTHTKPAPRFEAGQIKHDPTFDRDMEVYHHPMSVEVGLAGPAQARELKVSYQGCAEAGLCYPPQTRVLHVALDSAGQVLSIGNGPSPKAETVPATDTPEAAAAAQAAPSNELSRIEQKLKSGSLLAIAGVFALAGLLLSFTPCVLPMLPILSSIIVGQGQGVSRLRGFLLAASYSMGMAVVYTGFGVVAGLLGEGLAAALQNPWVLGAFAMLLVALSLSMFGAYNLQLPGSWQSNVSQTSDKMRAGSFVGVFFMGGLSALVVGPCVAAPLAGALVYISQTRDVVIGGVALFAMAMGMSVPLLLLGVSAGTLLPRAGAWMESVKTVFGMMLLAVALWLVQPVMAPTVVLFLAGVWLALGAAFLGAFDTLTATASVLHRSLKGMGLVMALLATVEMVGALAGSGDALRPLQPFTMAARLAPGTTLATANAGEAAQLPFRRVSSPAELESAIANAGGRTVVLDFYADWCVACKEMEHFTFSDPAVRKKLEGALLLQADVTANAGPHKTLMKRFGLFGPPGVLFFDSKGQERKEARVVGFQKAEAFVESLTQAGL